MAGFRFLVLQSSNKPKQKLKGPTKPFEAEELRGNPQKIPSIRRHCLIVILDHAWNNVADECCIVVVEMQQIWKPYSLPEGAQSQLACCHLNLWFASIVMCC